MFEKGRLMMGSGKTQTTFACNFPTRCIPKWEALETRRLLSVAGYAAVAPSEAPAPGSVVPLNFVEHGRDLIRGSEDAAFVSEPEIVQTVVVFAFHNDQGFDADFSRPESQFSVPIQPDFRGFSENFGGTTGIVIDAGWGGGIWSNAAWTNAIGPSDSFLTVEPTYSSPGETPQTASTGSLPVVANFTHAPLAPRSFLENQVEPVRAPLYSDVVPSGPAVNSSTSLVGEQNQNLFNETAIRHGLSGIAGGIFQSREVEVLNSLNGVVAVSSPALANWFWRGPAQAFLRGLLLLKVQVHLPLSSERSKRQGKPLCRRGRRRQTRSPMPRQP